MEDIRETLGACGWDPNYEEIAVQALKRGRNGVGRPFEVDVIARSTSARLGTVMLSGDTKGTIIEAVDRVVDFESGVDVLGQRIADLLVETVAEQRSQASGDEPDIFTRV